jgi:putative ABC transport system substrate-binding protein
MVNRQLKRSVRFPRQRQHDGLADERHHSHWRRAPGSALVVGPGSYFTARRDQIITLAARHAVPTISSDREFAAAGGLMSYSSSTVDSYRRAGVYAARILKGEKPADMPVERSTKFELVINLKAAKALSLQIPDKLLAIADEVIE